MNSSETELLNREIETLRKRLSRMCKASLRINESLEFEAVLQGVLESARSLTEAKYGIVALTDDSGRVQDCLASGLTPGEVRGLWSLPEGQELYEYFSNIDEPLRLRDYHAHIQSMGLPEFLPPMAVSESIAFLAAPIRHRGERVGTFFLAEKVGGKAFCLEDEETLVMFASQAALVITNARRHRDEQRARSNLHTLIDTCPVAVSVFDAKTGSMVSFNREMFRIMKCLQVHRLPTQKALAALTVRREDGSETSLVTPSIVDALSKGETVRAEEIVLNGPDGRSLTATLDATPIHSEDGQPESFVMTLRDRSQLDDLERLRAEFLAVVSHNLRGPLAAIKGSATTVLGDTSAVDRPEMVQLFHVINQQADHMRGLINDLLDVTSIRTGTLQVHTVPMQVIGLVDEARNTYLSGGGGNDVQMALTQDLPAVNADRRRINQVLVNLLSNASRHSPENSPLRVTASQDGVYVAVSVIDKGRGVSPERLPHLFRRNIRSDGEGTSSDDERTGWGLAICKGIVEAHGGRIWAESDGVGRGTRVTFTIPIAEDATFAAPASSASKSGPGKNEPRERTRILVVDDDPQALRKVREALSKSGYVPVATGDPDELPGLLEAHSPQLVLMDLVLPGTDGIEVMQTILQNTKVPVVFLSAYGHEEAIARALEAGAVDYVVKPFSPTELVARIRAVLRRMGPPDGMMPNGTFTLGELTIIYNQRRVTVAGRAVRLTDIEFRMLATLSFNVGQVLTYRQLMEHVWGRWQSTDTGRIRFAVTNIRRKLGDDARNPAYLFNEPRVGYRLGVAG